MKRANLYFLLTLTFCFSRTTFAATPDLADANKLFDFVETAEPTLFFPPVQTQQVNGAGSDWFYRYFTGSDSYVAININGVGPYFAGNVYVLGAQFGTDLLNVDTLENLLVTIGATNPLPSGGVNAITNQGNGNCVPRKFAARNDTARFRTTTFPGDSALVTQTSEFYEEVSNTKTITVFGQTTSAGGSQTVTSNRYSSYFESLNGMFFTPENGSVITTSPTDSPPSQQNLSTTYTPSLFIGPADFLCEGQEWFAAPVTQTSMDSAGLSGSGPVISQTLPTVGTINSIGDVVTVRAGTFSTVKMTLSYPNSRTIIWTDLLFGIRVMSESYQGDSESPSSTEELTIVELPF